MATGTNEAKLTALERLRRFLAGTAAVVFKPGPDDTRHAHIADVPRRFRHAGPGRPEKGLVLRCRERTTGCSRRRLTRWVTRFRALRQTKKRYRSPKVGSARTCTEADVALLAEPDAPPRPRSGPATCILMRRAAEVCGGARHERSAGLSGGTSL